jgi:PII-like signaling protein
MNIEEIRMLSTGTAKKVTIHLNEDTISGEGFLYKEVLTLLYQRGVAGAEVIHPAAGFGAHHRIHSQEQGWTAGEHMPVRIEFIDTPAAVEALLPALYELVTDGMIEAHDTTILKAAAKREQPLG